MCYLWLSKHYSMRHYSRNVWICVIPDILLLHQSMHRVSITFLQKTMRMGMMGVHPSGLHHLGDMCLIRHLHLDHCLKTRAKDETLIPRFCQNQPLQGQLLLSHRLTTFMFPRHLSGDLPLGMIPTPRMDSLILTGPCFDLYDWKQIFYEDWADPSTPLRIRYDYMRHGRQLSCDWHNPRTECWKGVPDPNVLIPEEWYHPDGHADLDDSVFKEFLQQQGSCQTSPTPARPRQSANPLVNPPRHSGQQQQPVHRPDNVYGDEAPIDILQNYDAFDVSRPSRIKVLINRRGLLGIWVQMI